MSLTNPPFVEMGRPPVSENPHQLNEHNMFLFDQQTPQVNRLEEMPAEFLHNLGYHPNHHSPGVNMAHVTFDSQYDDPSLWSEDASSSHAPGLPLRLMSSVSSPLVGVALTHNSSGATEVEPKQAKPRRVRDKPLLSAEESRLMECPDAQLSEKELAVKKKAQNRLAQRAFRERKETKLKDLETKLLESEDERQKLRDELLQIQMRYASLSSENRILRTAPPEAEGQNQTFSFPSTQDQFIQNMLDGNTVHKVNPENVNRIYNEPTKPESKLLAIGAVWDYLQIKQEEEEFENVDMLEVMQQLRGNEKCHGFGPAYALDLVNSVLHRVASSQRGW